MQSSPLANATVTLSSQTTTRKAGSGADTLTLVETVVATGSTDAAGDVVFAGLTPLPYRIDAVRAGGGAATTIRIAPPYASTVRVAVIIRPNS
jgi:hypothetical protein